MAGVAFRTVEEWPVLLLGPMVRKVTRTEAHVFIATKLPCAAQLIVVGPSGAAFQHSDVADSTTAGVELRALGANLYVGLLRVDLPDPAPNARYSYDVQLTIGGATARLHELGLLGSIDPDEAMGPVDPIESHVPLGYAPGILPSFLTPPSDLAELRLAHASCRKPHGNEIAAEADALPILDELIALALHARSPVEDNDPSHVWLDAAENVVTPAPYPPRDLHLRPHQLIFTGDQIYADDVAPGLLEALSDAAAKLMGWREDPPGIVPGINGFLVNPGWRTRYLSMAGLKEIPGSGETDYSQSHLLTFGEWCAMYLFAWSTALWPRSTDRSKIQLRDHSQRIKLSELIEKLEWYVDNPYVKPPPAATPALQSIIRALQIVKVVDGFEADLDELWSGTLDRAVGFGSTVPYVRRVLANTPSYMMFDDHEVTDDWFVDRKVAEQLIGKDPVTTPPPASEGAGSGAWWPNEVGPRLLRNALSAYAVFQHWGNVPDDFAGWDLPAPRLLDSGSVGRRLLTLWQPGWQPSAAGEGSDSEPDDDDSGDGTDGIPTGSRPWLAGPPQEIDPLDVLWDGLPWWILVPNPVVTQDEIDAHLAQLADGWFLREWQGHPQTRVADALLRIDTLPTDPVTGEHPSGADPADRTGFGRFRWDYCISFDSHRLIALDTRTWRRFPTEVAPIPTLSGVLSSRAEAVDATAGGVRSFSAALDATGDALAVIYSDLLDAAYDLAAAAGDDLDDVLTEVAGVAEAFFAAVSVGASVHAQVTLVLEDYRAELAGSAEFSARVSLDSDNRRFWRAVALVRQIADIVEVGPDGTDTEISVRIWFAVARYLEAIAQGSTRQAAYELRQLAREAGVALLAEDSPLLLLGATAAASLRASAIALADSMQALAQQGEPHDRSNVFFRDGSGYLAAELISAPALRWMLTVPVATIAPGKETVVLSPAPIFGDDIYELIQRGLVIGSTLLGGAGIEQWEFEAWSANPVGFDNLMVAGRDLGRAVVLSGDVHYGFSMQARARLPFEDVDTSYVQLTASSAKNSDPNNKRIALATDALWDKRGRFGAYQFSPVPLMRRAWDYFVPPLSDRPSSLLRDRRSARGEAGAPGPSFAGWMLEYFSAWLSDAARNYHLDDVSLMVEEYFALLTLPALERVQALWAWMWRWFYAPLGGGLLHGLENAGQFAQDSFEWIQEAPLHSFSAWMSEVAWWNFSLVQDLIELRQDPTRKIFGHYLFSRDVLLQQVADAYRAIGVDPFYGLQVEKQSLRDTRVDRMTLFGARLRFKDLPSNTYLYGHSQEVQTVGSANVGVIRYVSEPTTGRLGVQHDLLFYPFGTHPSAIEAEPGPWSPEELEGPDPGEVTGWYQPRDDWMATRHVAYFPHEAMVARVPSETPIGGDP